MFRRLFPLIALTIAACSAGDDTRPIQVDIIGDTPRVTDPIIAPPSENGAIVLGALAQGLVRFDSTGEIEPALAKRWIVLDDGLTYIFRLNDIEWADGTTVTAGQIARQLRMAGRAGSRNRLAPLLRDIEQINAVTPQILEINLARPRIDFLQLLAQPDLAIVIENSGLGPFQHADGLTPDADGPSLFTPYPEPIDENEEGAVAQSYAPSDTVQIRFARPELAVARFQLGQTDLVRGGGWTSLPYALAIDPAADRLVIDPTEGLFGLAIVEEAGFLARSENRQLLSMAIDRAQLAELLSRAEAEPTHAIIPVGVQELDTPALPVWLDSELNERRGFARNAVAIWEATNGEIATLRVALPDEAGSRIIFAVLRTNWAQIGIEVERVEWGDNADLRLVDHVAATDHASWFLQYFRCGRSFPCSDAYDEALRFLENAESERVRSIRLAEASTELEQLTPFIPLLRPIRWSLVSTRITGFRPNRHASHPLDQLIAPSS